MRIERAEQEVKGERSAVRLEANGGDEVGVSSAKRVAPYNQGGY
jgi:hypothetical protein